MSGQRIAAFGGTFDPVHNGHIEIARAVVADFALDQLLIIPAHRPPHKESSAIANAYHRYTMAVLASLDEPRMLVSTIELEAPDRPYTFETIERLRDAFGESVTLFFVMGADSFEEINTWREPARVLSSANIIVVTRPGHELSSSHLEARFSSTIIDLRRGGGETEVRNANENHIYLTASVNTSVSSTEIRQTARDGQSIESLVPPRVADYIQKYEVYRR
ncbi:MAG TPA: nicotinate-nucleotide adenylyltransferase [Blastocatellia bacterium]|nr:nicotinate-nucleotide adenylyltransferase [Blastocatellia bacterium]